MTAPVASVPLNAAHDTRTPKANALHDRYMALSTEDHDGMNDLCSDAIEEVERLELRLSDGAPGWIPVSERMPKDEQRVLVYRAGDTPPCDYGVDKASIYFTDGFVHHPGVTHWMPLPEAPK